MTLDICHISVKRIWRKHIQSALVKKHRQKIYLFGKNAKITKDVIYAFKNQNRMPFLVPVVKL
jgi:hypothetical protein